MKRKIQPISFNLDDVYERKLHEYALEQSKYFSKYVKLLIEKDRSGKLVVPLASAPVTPAVAPVKKSVASKSIAKGFL